MNCRAQSLRCQKANRARTLIKAPEKRLLDQVRDAIRTKHYSLRTEEAYLNIVRDTQGNEDRVTMLPDSVVEPLEEHLLRVRRMHQEDLAR